MRAILRHVHEPHKHLETVLLLRGSRRPLRLWNTPGDHQLALFQQAEPSTELHVCRANGRRPLLGTTPPLRGVMVDEGDLLAVMIQVSLGDQPPVRFVSRLGALHQEVAHRL
jgi:hypothetical protein